MTRRYGLWYARFFKTRANATRAISGGRFRLDGEVMSKPHRAAQLYEDLSPERLKRQNDSPAEPGFEIRGKGAGRPTKRHRRETQKLKEDLD